MLRSRLMAVAVAIGVAACGSAGGGGGGGPAGGAAGGSVGGGPSQPARTPPGGGPGDANIKKLIALGLPIYCAGPNGNEVAFTFDDGPGAYTHYAVKKLTESGERATFFAVGKSINAWPGWLARELKVAVIGDHSATHPDLLGLSPDEVRSQLQSTKQKIEAQTGQPVELWRPPYGARNATIDKIGQSLGMLEILWSTDSADSLGAAWDGIIRNVEAGLHPGAIILMHENRGQTIRALTTILPYMAAHHIRSVTLPQLFADDPPSESQVRAGPSGCSGGTTAKPGSAG